MHQPEPPTGDAIREARLSLFLTQAAASQRVGVTQSTYKRWEASKGEHVKISLRLHAKLLSAFPELRKEAPDVHAPPAPHDPSRAAE